MMKVTFMYTIVALATLNASAQTSGLSRQDTVLQVKIKKGDKYLSLPVKESSPLTRAKISLSGNDGKVLDQFTLKLSDEPDYWVFFDAAPYQGKTLDVTISTTPVPVQGQVPAVQASTGVRSHSMSGLKLIHSGVKYPGMDSLYREAMRPQVHFSSNRGWINDPNGLIYHKGEYHLYFQHNPYGWQWGNMHWGHAVSKDLLRWKQLPEAIYPYLERPSINGRQDAAFSGSAVIDSANTSGFRKNGIDPLIAFYTSTGRGEAIKLSYDNGRTFVEYPGNPVLKHNGRDPKVFWYEPGKHWVMVVWSSGVTKKLSLGQEASVRQHSIYTSPDLKNWTYQSGVSGFFECPELFELPVEGQNGVSKWVMYDAHGRYIVGDFNGKEFKMEQPFKVYAHGGGYFYASQNFNNVKGKHPIQIGWGRNIQQPGMPFNQAMLFPSELRLRKTFDGLRLTPTPIPAVKDLHQNSQVVENKVVGEQKVQISVKDGAIHVIAEIERGDGAISMNIMGYELKFDNEWVFSTSGNEEGSAASTIAGPFPPPSPSIPVTYVPSSDKFKIEAILDKNILEFYINDGELYYVTAFNGKKTGQVELSVPASGNGSQNRPSRKFILTRLEVHELKSIW